MTDKAALFKKAKRYLASARLLLEAADYDSAVSRIYYAAETFKSSRRKPTRPRKNIPLEPALEKSVPAE
ncbi:MAG: HEPN domain-containing protein [Sulfuricaulis sp.]|uniref:HEPN domain-containing protein n=1 Tax=Sulfuricaulis sp. TaxID=2003553 RepID=UPI0034A3F01E